MKRLLFVLAIAMLALPATALAKGPSEAKITGPGLATAIKISGGRDRGLADHGSRRRSRLLPGRVRPDPQSDDCLGRRRATSVPKYSIEYTVPGPDGGNQTIRQDVYPYATPYSVTYMKAGQAIFDMKTRGGWFTDSQAEGESSSRTGCRRPQPRRRSSSSSSAGFFSTGKLGGLVLVLLLLGGGFVLMRRRSGEATA